MTKSTITREQVVALIAEHSYDSALVDALEHLLAAMDSEPYGFTDGDRRGMIYKPEHADRLSEPVQVYRHAQPAPVVPTFDEWLELSGNKPLGWVKDVMRESYDACRAAMLNGGKS